MKFGYARVSSDGQSVDAQVRQLTKAGCKKVFREVASGAKTDRAQLRRLLDQLAPGDVPIAFTPDNKSLLYYERIATMRPKVFKIDFQTHKIEVWKEIPAPMAPYGLRGLLFSRDGKSYAYATFLDTGDLYLLDDVK